jgi:RHH-type rel operon transcriptional repressor/antitoxin RelB
MSTAISVRLPKNLADQLDGIAKETERPRSFIIQKALESYIEDFADLQIALDRLHDKRDAIISGKEMRESLGLYIAISRSCQKLRPAASLTK